MNLTGQAGTDENKTKHKQKKSLGFVREEKTPEAKLERNLKQSTPSDEMQVVLMKKKSKFYS